MFRSIARNLTRYTQSSYSVSSALIKRQQISSWKVNARMFSSTSDNKAAAEELVSVKDETFGAGLKPVVVTLAGPDKRGIVNQLTNTLYGLQCNFEESRMTVLGGDFAVIALVSVTESTNIDNIKKQISEQFPDYLVGVRPTTTTRFFSKPQKIYHITLEGPDQPGLVANFSKILNDFGCSVRDLDTDTSSAPFAGYRVFTMKVVVAIPTSIDADQLETSIGKFESEYGVDIRVDDPENYDEEERYNEEGNEEEDDQEALEEQEEEEAPKKKSAKTSSRRRQEIEEEEEEEDEFENMSPKERARLEEMYKQQMMKKSSPSSFGKAPKRRGE